MFPPPCCPFVVLCWKHQLAIIHQHMHTICGSVNCNPLHMIPYVNLNKYPSYMYNMSLGFDLTLSSFSRGLSYQRLCICCWNIKSKWMWFGPIVVSLWPPWDHATCSSVRILSCFQEEMMVQEDPIKIREDDELKQKKKSRSRYTSWQTRPLVD